METSTDIKEKKNVRAFKSYYVVWKRKNNIRKEKMAIWFKSYYVVWKPVARWVAARKAVGLNRTM